jgi:hypothetical protein
VKLCDALVKILDAGQHELPAIVEGLNQSDVAPNERHAVDRRPALRGAASAGAVDVNLALLVAP